MAPQVLCMVLQCSAHITAKPLLYLTSTAREQRWRMIRRGRLTAGSSGLERDPVSGRQDAACATFGAFLVPAPWLRQQRRWKMQEWTRTIPCRTCNPLSALEG
jgi:hypothetical protein